MVPISRRRFLVAGGITAAAGCLSNSPNQRSDDDTTTEDETTSDADGGLPEGLADALGLLPAAVDDEDPHRVAAISPEADGQYGENVTEEFGLDPSTVDYGVAATYGDRTGTLIAFTGSYDPAEASANDQGTSATIDGRFVVAVHYGDGTGWDGGLDATRNAADGSVESLADRDSITTALELFDDEPLVAVNPQPETDQDLDHWEAVDLGSVDAIATASTEVGERTRRITTAVVYEDESTVDLDAIRTMAEDRWDDGVQERTIEQDGRSGVATVVYERPPRPDREASPDAHFRVEYDDEAGEATVTHRGSEPVDAETLTVRVDGERADAQFADEYDTVGEGDSIALDTDPFSHVRVRWDDPDDEDTFDRLVDRIAFDRSVFKAEYDADASTVTITYAGERPADTDRLELNRRRNDGDRERRPDETPLAAYHETLTAGDRIVVEDVTPGDRVSVSVTVETENGAFGTSVLSVAARPPGHFSTEREDGTTRIAYAGHAGHAIADASVDEYAVLVDGEPAATQFADEYDELSDGDAIELDADPGATVAVEWTAAGETVEITSGRVLPEASFTFDRRDDGRLEVSHGGGEPVDAGRLTVDFHGRTDADPVGWGQAGTAVEPGDSITVEVPEDVRYVVVRYADRGIAHTEIED